MREDKRGARRNGYRGDSYTPYKAPLSTARLIIGIISILLFILVSFQSCAAGLSNALQDNGASSGSQGLLLSICLIVAGIIGIVTRNSESKGGPVTACVFYALGAVMTVGAGSTFGDLPIWGVISAAFAVVFLIAAVKTGKN